MRVTISILLLFFITLFGGVVMAPPTAVVATEKTRNMDLSIEDIMMLAAAMELENGCNGDLCLLYTGSVILNRVASPEWPNSVYKVLHQKGQYAERTLRNLDSVKVSERTMSLALKLVMCGSLDEQIVFQSMQPKLGHVKYVVDGEYFAY